MVSFRQEAAPQRNANIPPRRWQAFPRDDPSTRDQ